MDTLIEGTVEIMGEHFPFTADTQDSRTVLYLDSLLDEHYNFFACWAKMVLNRSPEEYKKELSHRRTRPGLVTGMLFGCFPLRPIVRGRPITLSYDSCKLDEDSMEKVPEVSACFSNLTTGELRFLQSSGRLS